MISGGRTLRLTVTEDGSKLALPEYETASVCWPGARWVSVTSVLPAVSGCDATSRCPPSVTAIVPSAGRLVPATATVKRTESPAAIGPPNGTETTVGAFAIVSEAVVASAESKFGSPPYDAVIACVPAGRSSAVNVAAPFESAAAPMSTPSDLIVIVPVGVMFAGATG